MDSSTSRAGENAESARNAIYAIFLVSFAHFKVLQQKVPYFNLNFSTSLKNIWCGLAAGLNSVSCAQTRREFQIYCCCASLSFSFMNNSQTKSPGYNKMQRHSLIVSLARSGSHSSSIWLPLAHSGSLRLAVRLSLARCPALSGSF